MDQTYKTSEELSGISDQELRAAEAEQQQPYTERPLSQRILAWICFAVVVLGLISYCYWQVVPLV